MNNKKLFISATAGFVVYFLLGWLVYGILLVDFYAKHYIGPEGVTLSDEEMRLWAMGTGNYLFALLLAYIYLRWANISTFMEGAKAGALIGGFIAGSINLMLYAMNNMNDLFITLVDIPVAAAVSSLVGGAIGWVLGKK